MNPKVEGFPFVISPSKNSLFSIYLSLSLYLIFFPKNKVTLYTEKIRPKKKNVKKSSTYKSSPNLAPFLLHLVTNFWLLCFCWSNSMESSSASSDINIKGVPTHGGKYVQYNVYGNLFEVSRKYVPPIRPVGRGAYGIVWWVSIHLFWGLSVVLRFWFALFWCNKSWGF